MKLDSLIFKFFILIFVSTFSNFIIGQNLVPNHSFETITSCPNGLAQIHKSLPWFIPANSFNNSPDLFNQCDSSSFVLSAGVPQNYFGFQQANSGNGYAGIICYGTMLGQDIREYVQIQLTSPLIAGESYEIEMYVSPSENYNLAVNRIGMHISIGSISGIGNWLLPFVPQINPSGMLLSDTASWTLISGTYIANGGEDHITVGNFYDDLNTYIGILNQDIIPQPIAYYYIDDISVTHNTGVGIEEMPDNFIIYPNPTTGIVFLSEIIEYKIYNLLGDDVLIGNDNTIDISSLKKGIYFIESDGVIQKILKQ